VGLDTGRLVISTEGKAQGGLYLVMGDRKGMLRFTDAPTTLAIEAGRGASSGADPETQPAPRLATLYVTRGKALWQEAASREVLAIDEQKQMALGAEPALPSPIGTAPAWIEAGMVGLLEQRASDQMEKQLQPNRPAVLALRELAEHRQKEVRWLAQRCLSAVGDFQQMVAALDSPEQKAVWPEYVEHLQQAVRRSPETAAQVRGAIEKVYSGAGKQAEAACLYEMLWKYQPERFGGEDAARLVEYLEHPTLAVRVLAISNLKGLTGLGLYYRPEDTAAKREPSVRKWKEWLASSHALKAKVNPSSPDESALPTAPAPEGAVRAGERGKGR
jgi:hypothetical protein